MWSRFTGKSDSGSSASKDRDEEARRRKPSDSTRAKRDRDSDMRSVVSSTSTRKPSRRDATPSSIASFATAFEDRARGSDDLYEDPRDERDARSSASTATRRDDEKERKKSTKDKDKDKDKDRRVEKRRSTRSERSGSTSIVESPKQPTRSFSGQIGSAGFSQFPGQAGAPLMSGALPAPSNSSSRPSQGAGGMSSHVQDMFPGQDPAQFTSSALPGGNPFGAAADYYRDEGESVHQQPGVRPQPPSVIIGQDTPHLIAASAYANPVADTGSGAAADFYGNNTGTSSSKPSRPSSMPGAFYEDEPAPQKPARPSSKPTKPNKPSKLKASSAATLASGAALGYAMGHNSPSNAHQSSSYSSSNNMHSASYTNGTPGPSASLYNQGANPSNTATDGSSYIPTYSQAMDGAPPPKPPRPGKPEKQSSGSNAGLYAAGAVGLAAYGLHQHNSHSGTHDHSHNYPSSTPGAFTGQNHNNGIHPSPSPYMSGGMTHQHQHTGPVSRFVDWWKDHEDVQKMEEYTEYIGVCKGCFDPRSSAVDAPRKHHYGRRRSSEYMRPSGGIEKQSRYSLKEKKSHSSFSSGDERRKKHSSSAAGWVAAGLGGIGLAKAGKAVLTAGRDDFDDTYSIKSGRDPRSKTSRHDRSRSRERTDYNAGRFETRRRSRSRDRMSQMSVGVTKDKKDHKIVRRRSRSRSRSSSGSRDRKSGYGKALGVGLAGAALGAAVSKRRRSRSRSRSPKKAYVHHRRDSSDDERRRRKSQQLRRKSSRSSASGASIIDISQNQQGQSGFLGGFFTAPPPKIRRKKSFGSSHRKKKKGFFNFGNGSSSSSDSEMAFGTGYVQRKRRSSPKRRNSDERLKATLAGLGATAAAIAAAKAARRNSGKQSEVVAVKQTRHQRKSSDRPRPGSRYGDDEWEDLPDDDTSDSSSNGGLVYGDYDWRKGKSQESLASNGSGTNKWGWRWGFGQKKRKSSDNLYDNIASTSFIGPAAAGTAGALTGAAIGSQLGRHDSEASSVQTLQSVYPVASNDPTTFDARRTSSVPTPQPLITSGPGAISLQQPQPVHQVPGSIYSTQAPSQPSYAAPIGPPVFSQLSRHESYPTQYQTQNVVVQAAQPSVHPPLPRRSNSSPIQSSSWGRNVAIAGLAGAAGAAAIAAARNTDRPPSSPSNVRFNLTKEQADKDERERYREQERRELEDSKRREQQRREEEVRRDEEDHRRREQQLREAEVEARQLEDNRRTEQLRLEEQRHIEEERRHRELSRQQEEARRYMETERLAKAEAERRADERRRQQDEIRAREARETEERERRERDTRADAQRRADQEVEAERKRMEQREAERIETIRRDAQIQEDMERQRKEREVRDYADRHGSDREQRKLEQQRTRGNTSSVSTDVRRKEKEPQESERDSIKSDTRKSTVGNVIAAGAAAAIAGAAIDSYKGRSKDKKEPRDEKKQRRRESSPSVKIVAPSNVKTYEPAEPFQTKTFTPTTTKMYEPSEASTVKTSNVKTIEPKGVVTYAPSAIKQDYADDDIFDPNMFKKSADRDFVNKKQTVSEIFHEWDDKYSGPQPTQAEVFAPLELLQNDNLPKVRQFDPNEGATNLTMSEAHADTSSARPMAPPYPAAYAFIATRDGRSHDPLKEVPSLNLIAPTPPGSRAPSVRSASVPPSPNIEPIQESKNVPEPEDANRARSRVSWGENQFHHFEVRTPDSYREQFVSEQDLKDQEQKYSQDQITVERDSPKSGQKTTTYEPYRPGQASISSEPPEIAPSTQPIQQETGSDWDSIVDASSKKSSKRDKKKAKAAAAAAVTAASVVALSSQDEWDDHRRDASSVISNPFSDSHYAASTIAPSTIAPSTVASSIPSSSSVYQSPTYESTSDLDLRKGKDSALTAEPESMHIPGSFDEPELAPAKPLEGEWDATTTTKSGKKTSKSTDDIVVRTEDARKRAESESTRELDSAREAVPDSEVKLSKKDKKKKSKAAKRASVDSWEESDVTAPFSTVVERNVRDQEPASATVASDHTGIAGETSRSKDVGSSIAAATMAGGFAALLGNAFKQDQQRIASDSEHARESLQSVDKHDSRDMPSSFSNGTRTYDNGDRSSTAPSTALDDEDLVDAKSPRRKKDKRHSSGRFSPTIGSPLRTETKYEDYMGTATRPPNYDTQAFVEAPKVPTESALVSAPATFSSRNVYDSGYHAPDDLPRKYPAERDSDEFFSASSDEKGKPKNQKQENVQPLKSSMKSPSKYTNEDVPTTVSPKDRYDDATRLDASTLGKLGNEIEAEDRHRERQEAKSESREHSRDRSYGMDDGSERKRRHRRRDTDEPADDWDNRSTISDARSDANGERRRKHKRREGERDGSLESTVRSRSSAASEPSELHDERKSSRRRSKRDDDDDNASVISTSSRHDEDRSSRKEKEKRSSGLFGLFSKSKESLAETPSKSTKAKDDDEEEGKRRRRKHRSDRGSTYGGSDDDDMRSTISSRTKDDDEEEGKRRRRKHRSDRGSTYGGSDDDDMRSTISSSSRREKRSSRSERTESDRRDSYDEKVHRSSHAR